MAAYLTYWLENVAVHHLRENTHTRYTACVNRYLIPGLGKKKLTKLTAKDVRTWLNQLRITCQCCAHDIDARRNEPRCCAIGACCSKRLSPLTLAYVHSVLKSALEHAVREEEIPRNVARNVRTGTPRPRRFEPLTADEARQFLTAARGHRLHALFELALHIGLRRANSSACTGKTSTSTLVLPPSAVPCSAPAGAVSPRCPPRPGPLSAASPSPPAASSR